MISMNNYKEYKIDYYKVSSNDKELISEVITDYLCRNKKFEFKKTIHSTGFFLERRKVGLLGLLSCSFEIVFSERNDYSLISVRYHEPIIAKYFWFVLMVISLIFISGIQLLSISNNIQKLISLLVILLLGTKDFIVNIICRFSSKDTRSFIYELGWYEKLNAREYHQLLNTEIY